MFLEKAVEIIKDFENFEEKAYPDPKLGWELPTIGYGTTIYPNGSKVKIGDTCTKEKALEYMKKHIEDKILPKVRRIPSWPLMNDCKKAAIISFAYNLGANFYGGENFKSITEVLNKPNSWTNDVWVMAQFVKYRNPGSNVEKGLKRRREKEAQIFLSPCQ